MKIISFDQALNKTGYCIMIDGVIREYGLLKQSGDNKLKDMQIIIYDLIKKELPDIVVIEDVTYQSNIKTVKQLSMLQGAIYQQCYLIGCNHIYEMYPSEWRKLLGMKQGRDFKRKQLKQQQIDYVRDKYTIICNDDVADAICIISAFKEREVRYE